MPFTNGTRHLLLTMAVLTAAVIQLARGYRFAIVLAGAITFLAVGNLVIFLAGARERAARRRRAQTHWSH